MTQRTQLDVFIDYLLDENTRYNLTAVKERQAAHERHVLDSLTLLDVIDKYMPGAEARPVRLLDVGSGPGLPGVILAIARPNWRVRTPRLPAFCQALHLRLMRTQTYGTQEASCRTVLCAECTAKTIGPIG